MYHHLNGTRFLSWEELLYTCLALLHVLLYVFYHLLRNKPFIIIIIIIPLEGGGVSEQKSCVMFELCVVSFGISWLQTNVCLNILYIPVLSKHRPLTPIMTKFEYYGCTQGQRAHSAESKNAKYVERLIQA